MRTPKPTTRSAPSHNLVWQMLTFDRLMTGPIVHLIYWAGLGLIVLAGFTVIGAAVGVAVRDGSLEGALLAIPVVVAGALVLTALVLLWRGACEFYLAVFRIAEDLGVLRRTVEAEAQQSAQPIPAPASPTARSAVGESGVKF